MSETKSENWGLERQPTLYEYSAQVYKELSERAFTVNLGAAYGNEEGLVYEGFLTRLIKDELNFATPYYTKIMNELKRMQCVVQLRRGGSTTASRWLLITEPTIELWKGMKAPVKHTMIGDQIATDMNSRVFKLETAVELLMEKVFGEELGYSED